MVRRRPGRSQASSSRTPPGDCEGAVGSLTGPGRPVAEVARLLAATGPLQLGRLDARVEMPGARASGRRRAGRRGGRQAPGGAVAKRLLEVGYRADDLVEGTALAAGIGEPLAREEPPCLVLMAPARRPTLEQAVVDGGTHPPCIGTSLPPVESLVAGGSVRLQR